jgi:hypothetical protein
MTTRTVTHLIITAALAGSAAAGLQLSPSLASTQAPSALLANSEAVPSGGALFVRLHRVADRFSASCAGLKLSAAPVVCLTP